MRILNFFFRSQIFNNLHKFFTKKIFKIFKIFFVDTSLKELPSLNYPITNDELESDNFKKTVNNENKPYITYSHLPDLISVMMETGKKFNFYDYGAGNLNLYLYLNRKFKHINYFFKDQIIIENKVKEIISKNKLNNLFITENNVPSKIDIVYFGSSIQYIINYKEQLSLFFKKSKYILISQSPFFENNSMNEKIILKQLNMHPNINHLYLFNFSPFIKFMKENGYTLIEKNLNKVTKFLNFKNFDKIKFKEINMYDLLFELDNEKK
jgi:hypothetical protein